MVEVLSFGGSRTSANATNVTVDLQAHAAALRAEARDALECLTAVAQRVQRRDPTPGMPLAETLAAAADSVDVYCAYLSANVEPAVSQRAPYGNVLASHLRYFAERQRREFQRLFALVQEAPRSAGVAHGVFIAAVLLNADMEAHGQDLALVMDAKRVA